MKLRHLLLVSLLAFGSARAELPDAVARLAAAAGIPENAIGAVVLRGDTILVSNEADQLMRPASSIKLFTTIVALEELGPTFRGRTELRSSGTVANGVLKGDLILRGGADLDFNEDALTHLLERLRAQGIRKVAGDLVLDRQLFQPARTDLGKPPFDESPESYYNIIPDALLLNLNLQRLDLQSSASGVQVQALPALDGVTVRSAQTLVDGDCAEWEDGWKTPEVVRDGGRIAVVLKGTFPRHCRQSYNVNVLDRDDYADRLFRTTWKRLGGTIAGRTRTVDLAAHTSAVTAAAVAQGAIGADGTATAMADSGTRLLAEHVSRALPELVRDTLKMSDNALARTLYLSLGSLQPDPVLGSRPLPAGEQLAMLMAAHGNGKATAQGSEGDRGVVASTQARAEGVVRRWLKRHRIDDSGLVIENGSGLSRIERVRPVQLAALLTAAQDSLWAPEFQAALPIAGIDGTMRRRLAASPAASRARLKTGTMKGTVALAGYVPDANGEQCIVVAIVNHDNAGNGVGRGIVDALVDWVANSSAGSAM
ncbi:D-alanyl-D-alanine carboxypeptidase/D-alanyl-D-alanine-endopeptidase (penicillin-binding protein 4) [Pseudoduganella lurida]|uniref:D-alanyl-D-alanine carboxypeptidase/D-alanyl-D-alanine-endopeptidase (Penicillin-binding protein 4) n=1 Tax=Pseudoduganella lurida TaxID=1036180 RepID=A0A562QZ29_9BURK|nr:D-alanyl-D-alanine carboxypeptidase [Pseudoduganella lurida]TWI61833.1 D-alanyl-D-alanine carboxypeptidase/D-alanyl-D-alanine-endopeptidase (penicillin-binding protein 4) [Pseudoduganella lurida]